MADHRWMRLHKIEQALPAMEADNVEPVARGASPSSRTPLGFLDTYRQCYGSPSRMKALQATRTTTWRTHRTTAIRRILKQMAKKDAPLFDSEGIPSRGLLRLIAWAYTPPRAAHRLRLWYAAGAPARIHTSRNNPSPTLFEADAALPATALMIPLPDDSRRLFLQVAHAHANKRQLQIHGDVLIAMARSLVRMRYLRITREYAPQETVHGQAALNLTLASHGKRIYEAAKKAEEKEASMRQTGLFG